MIFYLASAIIYSTNAEPFHMKKYLTILIISIFLISPYFIFSQEKKPKVALVLSGGGAKGMAHIATLQALDSLGIVPDLVIGTSMGSIVGGLYAMGYSGDSIAAITKDIDWGVILGGSISLVDVGVEEKSEFNKYLTELDLVKGKPKLSDALLKDQKLREFITSLIYPVYSVTDFDDLSIPFRAMTTDIVNGKEVLLDSGSLAVAMRASMSIPGVFKPVPYKDVLLVDGGVLNNFPTDVAKSMGADIIIGSDVGGGMASIEDLNSISSLLFQAAMLTSNLKAPENIKLCDIFIDHVPNLTYSTGNFDKGNELYEEGKIATEQSIDQLIALAEKLKGFQQRTHKIPDVTDEIMLDTIIYTDISEANLDLVKARADLQTHKKYTSDDIIYRIDKAMGTNLFSQITYTPVIEGDKVGLELIGLEHSKHQVKGSLHYDTYRGVGLVVNYTGRNVLGQASRFLATVDIAQQPMFGLQYQKNFGDKKMWWWHSDALYEYLKNKVYIKGQVADDMRFKYLQFDNQVNRNINSLNSYVGIGINYENTSVKPITDPEVVENVLDLDHYYYNNFEIYAHYIFRNMDKRFYPTRGIHFRANISRSVWNDLDLVYADDALAEVKGSTNNFSKLGLDLEKRFRFHNNITGILGANTNFIFEDQIKSGEESFTDYGYAARYFLGGNLRSSSKNSFIFPGLREDELNVSQFMKLNLGVQFMPVNNVYLTPHFNVASVGFRDFDDYIEYAFSPNGDWQDGEEASSLMSAGLTVSYDSFLGPINFDASWVDGINDVRLFFSLGLFFD